MTSGHTVCLLVYRLECSVADSSGGDIMSSILPEGEQDELPSGFSITGHIGENPARGVYAKC